MKADRLLIDCHVATMIEGGAPYGAVEDAAVVVADGRIAWAGPRADMPTVAADEVERLDGRWVTPGLIDCHTHLVFGGDRSGEFEQRLQGASYEEIARAGGGIVSSVKATRAASEDQLFASAMRRLEGLKDTGVTTVEIKSGYGLDRDSELKMLRVARRIGREGGVRVRTAYLGLHAVPPEHRADRAAYVDKAVDGILPAAHAEGLVDMVDAYCEPIAFSGEEVARLFDKARALGLPVKLHADQLSDGGGAALAARYQALSADHIEHTTEAGVKAMAEAGVVAVLLPGAYLMLRETQTPPVDLLRRHGVRMAVATDCNPGTSPLASMTAAMNLACVQFRLTPEEALAGATRNAARALGLKDVGVIAPGMAADLAAWDVARPAELAYWLGKPMLHRRWIAGAPAS
ncbi:MAG: imidazolonepropionase [Brevundimonas sp.]|uniref:Imidazolonepropionase n=1 Tax=Brevundimonas albigilva TaxID=1312364 RepID=A0ABY4SRS6_9CAUL|nr:MULTISPECIES: imidazolonepropionase [Brevundimonas]PZU61891.1 MAG: imidazolonepropionase [Brevundimonas sp.]UQV18656.1 imidazolonepropionase [Brevundimonas albigilva]URI16566.1 imidazolonepropionase [Brevundimonas albigilva]